MANDLSVECTIQQVESDQSSGWYTIVTDQGKFTTKIAENAQEALSLQGQRVLLYYQERVQTKPAPDGQGMRTYRNRYYSRAGSLGAAAPQSGFVTTGQGQAQPQDGGAGFVESRGENPERSWRICLQTGGKLAVSTMPLMPNEQRSFDVQKQIALAWAKFFFFTPVPVEIAGTAVMPNPIASPQEAYEDVPAAVGGGYDEPPPHTDDDIPY